MLRFPFAAVLFDLDGVIIDTQDLHFRVWHDFGAAHGHTPSDAELMATPGVLAAEIIRSWLGKDLDDAEVARLTVEREEIFNRALARSDVRPVAGVVEFIDRLVASNVRRAVVTSAVPANARLPLSKLGLIDRFDAIVTAADVEKGKPDPEPYLKAAKMLDIPASRCLVIEDSISGIRSARAAGARCLALTTTFPRGVLEAERPDWIAADYHDLPLTLR